MSSRTTRSACRTVSGSTPGSSTRSAQWPEAPDKNFPNVPVLLRHARATVPYYRQRLAGLDAGQELTLERWRALPILARSDLQGRARELTSDALPPGFGATAHSQTSGATGQPVTVSFPREAVLVLESSATA